MSENNIINENKDEDSDTETYCSMLSGYDGLLSIILLTITDRLERKVNFKEDKNFNIHLYTYQMMAGGLGAIDEYIDYFIGQLDQFSDDEIKKVERKSGNTLLHILCIHTCNNSSRFCYRIFQYLIMRGIDIRTKNKKGKTCIQYLSEHNKCDDWYCGEELCDTFFSI